MSLRIAFNLHRGDFALDVELDLPATGVTAVTGPSGAGKTTLLRAVAGLDHHPGGTVTVGPDTWQSPDPPAFLAPHRRAVGYVAQHPALFPHLTVRGNLDYAHKRARPQGTAITAQEAAALLRVDHRLDRRPDTLSGGERQRAAVARAIASNPRLLLMDEPLAALDEDTKNAVLPDLAALQRQLDIPVLYVTHAADEVARLADHLVLLDSGRTVASGPAAEILTRPDLPPARARGACSVLDATVASHDPSFALASLDTPAGPLAVPAATPLEPGTRLRVAIAARDLSLTLTKQEKTSILNVLPAAVKAVDPDPADPARTVVLLHAGPADTPLLAHLTRRSAHDLALAPGQPVFAQVKSVALLP